MFVDKSKYSILQKEEEETIKPRIKHEEEISDQR
jgi:hypothetical protein